MVGEAAQRLGQLHQAGGNLGRGAAFALEGPALIDVFVDPAGYPAQLQAMRG